MAAPTQITLADFLRYDQNLRLSVVRTTDREGLEFLRSWFADSVQGTEAALRSPEAQRILETTPEQLRAQLQRDEELLAAIESRLDGGL